MYDQKKVDAIKNVIIYSRVHELDHGGDAYLLEQERLCKEFAEKQNWNVVQSVQEVACGMLDDWSRPVFKKALKDARDMPVRKHKCILLVSSVDRLSKDAHTAVHLMNLRDPRFFSVKDGVIQDRFMMQIGAAYTLQEWKNKYPEKCSGGYVLREHLRNSDIEYAKFWSGHINRCIKYGMTYEEIVKEKNSSMYGGIDFRWDEQTIENILTYKL